MFSWKQQNDLNAFLSSSVVFTPRHDLTSTLTGEDGIKVEAIATERVMDCNAVSIESCRADMSIMSVGPTPIPLMVLVVAKCNKADKADGAKKDAGCLECCDGALVAK